MNQIRYECIRFILPPTDGRQEEVNHNFCITKYVFSILKSVVSLATQAPLFHGVNGPDANINILPFLCAYACVRLRCVKTERNASTKP